MNDSIKRLSTLKSILSKEETVEEPKRNEILRQKLFVLSDMNKFVDKENLSKSYSSIVDLLIRVLGRRPENRAREQIEQLAPMI